MKGSSSLFLTKVQENPRRANLLARCSRVSRVSALAQTLNVAADYEANRLAEQLAADIAPPSRNWGHSLPGVFQPWLELFHDRFQAPGAHEASKAAFRALVGQWGRLATSVRLATLRRANGCFDLESALAERDEDEQESFIRFALESGLPKFAPRALQAVLATDHRVARVAEEAVAQTAAGLVGANVRELGVRPERAWEALPPPTGLEWRRVFRAGLASLCAEYQDHRRVGVLGAAVAALDRSELAYTGTDAGDPLGKWLVGGSPNSHPSLRSMLRRGVGPLMRLRAWEWLTRAPVQAAAMERFAWVDSTAEHEVVLSAAHLMENPARAARAKLIQVAADGSAGPVPNATAIAELSPTAKRGMVRMCAGLRTREADRERWVEPFLTDSDAGVRMSVASGVRASGILDYCYDSDESVAVTAALKWNWSGRASAVDRLRLFSNLTRSPHAKLRWLGSVQCEFEGELVGWSERSRLRELRDWREDRTGTLESIRAGITFGEEVPRVGAIMTARRLGLQRQVESELLDIIGARESATGSGTLAAVAVSALGELGSESAVEAVRACLKHPVARVRSNAVESLSRRERGRGDLPFCSPRLYEAMIEMKDEGSHRVRATALREILSAASPVRGGTGFEPTAAEGLLAMLHDDRPMHRLAALWAMERVASPIEIGDSLARRWDAMSSRVAELTVDEADEAVRRRAVRCARRMLARMGDGERQKVEAAA